VPGRGQRVDRGGEVEVVEVTEDHDVRVPVGRHDLVDEVAHLGRLLHPLHLRGLLDRLEPPVQRVVAALGDEVVRDHEDRLAAPAELAASGLRLSVQAALVGSIRPGENDRCGRPARVAGDRGGRGRGATRPVDERQPAVGPEQEHHPDVAARLAAVGVVDRVDLAELVRRAAGRGDRRDQPADRLVGRDHAVVGGAGVVLDLLERQHVRRPQVLHRVLGQRVELGLRILRRQVLHVERRHRELLRGRRLGELALQAAAAQRRRRGRQQLEVAEVVVDDAGGGTRIAVTDVRPRHGRQRVGDDHALRVGVVRLQDDAAAGGADRRAGRDDGRLAELVGRADHLSVVDRDEHALERLPEVEPVGGRVERGLGGLHVAVASSSITVAGGTRPPGPTTVGAAAPARSR
jgi:hypothetical protein